VNSCANSVDVVIPVYNGASTICAALESVVAQTNVQIGEIIIVNDGSTDDTLAQVHSLSLPNVRLITIVNSGVSTARNTGIAASKSEWIAFLDADDFWFPDKLERQLLVANREHVRFVCSAIAPGCKKPEGTIQMSSLWRGNFVATSSVLIKREIAQNIAPMFSTSMSFAEDYAAWFKVLSMPDGSGFFISTNLTDYFVSPRPNYRLGKIVCNLLLLQLECLLHMLAKKVGMIRTVAGCAVLICGTSISMLSILKRFFNAHFGRNRRQPS